MVTVCQYLSISQALSYSYNNPRSLLQLLSPFTVEETHTEVKWFTQIQAAWKWQYKDMSSNIWLRSLPLTPLLLFLYHNSLELELRGHRKGIYFYRRGNQSWELQANKQNIKDESEVLRFVMKIPKTGSRVA